MKPNKLIGDKKFYIALAAVVLPIMAQNGITQFVGLLDNLMVGRIGTEQMSGVSIVNQILNVFNLCLFGGMSGAGIFTAQFHGKGDVEGVRRTVRYKWYIALAVCALAYAVFLTYGEQLISFFINESDSEGDLELVMKCGKEYLAVLMWSFVPFALTQAYSSTLRETGNTVVPMIASGSAVFINLIFNYLLIFGKLGFPEMGVVGAAIATLISRIIEALIVVLWTHLNPKKNKYAKGLFSSLGIPAELITKISAKGLPLLINEFMWSLGMTVLAQSYSMRGLDSVAAYNITSTISNLFGIVFISMGNAVGIIVGQKLGADDIEGAKVTASRLMFTSTALSLFIGGAMACFSGIFPQLYNTTPEIKSLASSLIIVASIWMPINAYTNACYFTLRSGGQVLITMLFDSCFVWAISVPIGFILSHYTSVPTVWLYAACTWIDIVKCIIGTILVKSGKWAKNIVQKNKNQENIEKA